jgi:hypothetical protein
MGFSNVHTNVPHNRVSSCICYLGWLEQHPPVSKPGAWKSQETPPPSSPPTSSKSTNLSLPFHTYPFSTPFQSVSTPIAFRWIYSQPRLLEKPLNRPPCSNLLPAPHQSPTYCAHDLAQNVAPST